MGILRRLHRLAADLENVNLVQRADIALQLLQEIAEQRSTTKKKLDRADSNDEEGGNGGKGRRKKKRRSSRRRRSAAFQESKLARATIGRGLYTEEDLLSDILGCYSVPV